MKRDRAAQRDILARVPVEMSTDEAREVIRYARRSGRTVSAYVVEKIEERRADDKRDR